MFCDIKCCQFIDWYIIENDQQKVVENKVMLTYEEHDLKNSKKILSSSWNYEK